MKLLSLKVENFRCVRKAKIDFGPGLNVLHGPNDLGKSSLADAIRAALLLQAGSKDYVDFVTWGDAADPQVELVFQTEPQRIWRVRKTFGTGAQAFLDESRDGVDFHVEARGREVDGRLSGILRWGLAPPGGKGRPKGMPMTFLTTALLAEQDRVAAIFEQALSSDSDESGKKWLVEALHAAAEDPLFKLVLSNVQEHVDKAFTERGRRRAGKDSPWTYIRDLINQKEDYARQCSEQAQRSRVLESEIKDLLDIQLGRSESLNQAEGMLKEIEESHAQGRKRREILTRLQERRRALSEITRTADELKQSEERLGILIRQRESAFHKAHTAQSALKDAKRQVQAAKDRVARLQSDDTSRERLIKRGELEKRRAELETETLHIQAEMQLANSAISQAAVVDELEKAHRSAVKNIEAIEQQHGDSVTAMQTLDDQEHNLVALGHLLRARLARAAIEGAEKNLAQISLWLTTAREKRAEVEPLKTAFREASLPSLTQLTHLRQLANDLDVARARVDVGLHATVRPKRPVRLAVRKDGEARTQHDLTASPLEVTGSHEISLEIEDLVEVLISGGVQDARDSLAALENRWTTEAQPILTRAKAANLDELTHMLAAHAQRSSEIEDRERAASQLDQRVADQPDWTAALAQSQLDLATAERSLGTLDRKELEAVATRLEVRNPTELDNRLVSLRDQRPRLAAAERALNSDLAKAKALSEESQKSLTAAKENLAKAISVVQGEPKEALQRVVQRQGDLDAERNSILRDLTALATEDDKTTTDAQKALHAAETLELKAEQAQVDADKEVREVENAYAAWEREVDLWRAAAARFDEKGARDAVSQVEAELNLVPEPPYEITDEALADAQQQVRAAADELNKINDDLLAKRGALQHIGGDVAKQRAEDAEEALALAREKQHALEDDYNAWDLLRGTLKEAEQEEGVHLGRALGGPIAQRFGELTSGRYGRVALGPNLESQAISASGEDHSISSLSIGTRDQLSTIFRLSLAEQLQSTVLLDDQLTQSDHERLKWLRGLLKELAATTQIIVLTCRPGDYLLPEELTQGVASAGDSSVRSIDLLEVIGTTTKAGQMAAPQ